MMGVGRGGYYNTQSVSLLQILQTNQGFHSKNLTYFFLHTFQKGAFTPNVKSVLSENLGGILGGTQF
jgi:hypothetical protein